MTRDDLRALFNQLVAKGGAALVDEIIIEKLGLKKFKDLKDEQLEDVAQMVRDALANLEKAA